MNESFSLAIGKFIKKAPESADKIVKKVCFDLYQHFVDRTPYDTGRARGGWAIGVNERRLAPEGRCAEPGTKANTSVESMFGEAKSILAEVKGDCVVYMCNNVEYIVPLEEGWSKKQAPAGMVRVTLREYQKYVRDAVAAGL